MSDFTLVPLTRTLALVYYYIHKVCTRKKKRFNSMHTSECKKTKRPAHRYRYIPVHYEPQCQNIFFFFLCPILAAYQHTDNMAYLLVAFGQFAHRKITAKIMCTVQFLQHLILRCAQRMCTAHNNYVQVMHMTYRQAGCFIK